MATYVYIDASNMFYGGRKSLGWSIDYEKLIHYLKEKYDASSIYYFGGADIHRFPFDYLNNETIPLHDLEEYLLNLIENKEINNINEKRLALLSRHYSRVRFYTKLEEFGYKLILKPVKTHYNEHGGLIRKANCDVDMTLMITKEKDSFDRVLVMSGDGDFLPVLKYLRENQKEVIILARGVRTAKEIKQFAGGAFLDFEYLQERLKYIDPEEIL